MLSVFKPFNDWRNKIKTKMNNWRNADSVKTVLRKPIHPAKLADPRYDCMNSIHEDYCDWMDANPDSKITIIQWLECSFAVSATSSEQNKIDKEYAGVCTGCGKTLTNKQFENHFIDCINKNNN